MSNNAELQAVKEALDQYVVPLMAAYIRTIQAVDAEKRRSREKGGAGEPNFAGSAPGPKLRTTLLSAVREAQELAKKG